MTLQSTDYKTVQTNKHVVKYYLSICVKLFLVIWIFVGCPDLGFAECCSFALRETVQELGAEKSSLVLTSMYVNVNLSILTIFGA